MTAAGYMNLSPVTSCFKHKVVALEHQKALAAPETVDHQKGV